MDDRQSSPGVTPAEGGGGLPSSLLEAIEAAGGLWFAGEVPFTDLSTVAAAFPSLRSLGLFGAARLRSLGDVGPWRAGLACLGTTFAALRSLDGIEALEGLAHLSSARGARGFH